MRNWWRRRRGSEQRCVIVGCGGHGRVVLDILRTAGGHSIVGFVDSNPALVGVRVDGVAVVTNRLDRLPPDLEIAAAIVAVGDNRARQLLAGECTVHGLTLINAVHPSANIAGTARLGCNVVVAAGALICAHCRIGDSSILNTGCIVDHETVIGRAAHICPGARLAGRVNVDDQAFVGLGATVIQNVTIGRGAVVGAGAVVIRDVRPGTVVVGVPARECRDRGTSSAIPFFAEHPPEPPHDFYHCPDHHGADDDLAENNRAGAIGKTVEIDARY